MIKMYEIVRKSDSATLYVLQTGEVIYSHSCSTVFTLPVAKSFFSCLGLTHRHFRILPVPSDSVIDS